MAGLTLLRYLIKEANCKKKILLIDSSDKTQNDKTYSFWSKNDRFIKDIPHQKWSNYELHFDETTSAQKKFLPYSYYSIRSIDYYNSIKELVKGTENIYFENDRITEVDYSLNVVKCSSGKEYTAPLIFNSIFNLNDLDPKLPYSSIKQHFKGYVIECRSEVFDPDRITLMDFRIDQNREVHFFYVLPESKSKALIEYTVFSKALLEGEEYDSRLKKYIDERLNIKEYKILETEFGVIPMTDKKFSFRNGTSNIYNIGTIAGFVKGSTGYSFYRCNERILKLVQCLVENNYTIPSGFDIKSKYRHRLYDSILLSAMFKKQIDTKRLFQKLYLDHKDNLVFKFLDEQTRLYEEIKIMLKSPPRLVFNFFSRIFRFWKW